MDREKIIIKTSIIGILTNILLALFKAIVGIISNSIAIVLDAVNNLSDALSSLITIIGTKIAGKAPDKKHPMGYGRVEFLSATLISFIVLYAGITSLKESFLKILHPEVSQYSNVTLIIVFVGIITKIILGYYTKKKGKEVDSMSLVNSGEDATLDSIISASTLIAAFIYMYFHISLEAYLGFIISIVIIKSGIEMLQEAISEILGERVESSFSKEIKKTIASIDNVYGAYDLVLHSYGPDNYQGSVHIEIQDTLSAVEIDDITRKIQQVVYQKHHVILTGIGIYVINTKDEDVIKARRAVQQIVKDYKEILQVHGFYINKETKLMQFDIVFEFVDTRDQVYQEVYEKIKALYPDYEIRMNIDVNISD